jgi:hypothetical protein
MLRLNIWPHLSNGDKEGWKKIFTSQHPLTDVLSQLAGMRCFVNNLRRQKNAPKMVMFWIL